MAFNRPTFHEAWYRVADLRPRLLSTVRVYRQHFRGQLWYILENPSNNQFSRVSKEAYRFIGMLDGKRTIAEAWNICNEKLGDAAMTQPEVLELLGQLHSMNLLYVDLPPDSEVLFNRYSKRVRREVQSYLMNILFVRIPILDPDRFLERWVKVFGRVFSWPGLALWLALIAVGLYFVVANLDELVNRTSNVLDPGNLILLYLTFVVIKVIHEFSHAFACKRFGRLNDSTGEVHTMGVMFLVFVPLPYLDASTAWAFRSKWHRALVGMAGVMAELAIAAIAAAVWANTSAGTLHAIAYNAIFVASVSTLLFNGNFLLRFDAYYVLADLIEIPNLGPRSREYLFYLVKRYIFGVTQATNPAHTVGERYWFVFYGIASTAYRVFISIRIMLFLNDRLPEELSIVVPVLIFCALVGWVCVPVGKFFKYLATSPELARKRPRALAATAGFALAAVLGLGFFKVPDHCRVEGVIEPAPLAIIYAETDGFISNVLPSDVNVTPEGPALIESRNPALAAQHRSLIAERRALAIRREQARTTEFVAVQILDEELAAFDDKIARVEQQIAGLNLRSPLAGRWVSSDIEHAKGRYVRRGEQIGVVADLNDMLVRATAGQNVAATLIEQAHPQVAIRAWKRPEVTVSGTIEKISPAGQQVLPSESLGYTVGGSMPVDMRDPRGTKTAEMFFEIRIRPQLDESSSWRTGQRVVVRARLHPKPLAAQVWHYARQLLQQRLRI
jgi:putative peptide zinc metalloprotease protein